MGKNKLVILCFSALFMIDCTKSGNPSGEQPAPIDSGQPKAVNINFPEAIFTDSQRIEMGLSSTRIMDRLIGLIEAVPNNGSVYISIYMFNYTPLTMALIKAGERGVHIHITVDMSDRSDNENTIAALKNSISNLYITEVKNDASSIAINHNKFVLFPEVVTENGIAEHVIFQTSQNFMTSGTEKIQDAVVLSQKGLFDAYMNYWDTMKSLASSGMSDFEYVEYNDPDNNLIAWFHPKRKDGSFFEGDNIVELLDQITEPSTTSIKIGMSEWTDTRLVILEKLNQLYDEGAQVEIITKSSIGTGVLEGLNTFSDKGAKILVYNMESSGRRINIHSKIMLISGEWNGEKSEMIITGTQNFTRNALQNNNEITLILKNHELYDLYEEYFDELTSLPAVCCN